MSSVSGKKKAWLCVAVILLRFLLGGLFLFSGFAKSVDLWGGIYKFDDYFSAFGWEWAMPFSGFFAVVLSLVEFILGLMLVIGSFRRGAVAMLLCLMAFMLPLSFYIFLENPVSDCGCFGDAIVISNAATFWKNVLIVVGLVVLLKYNRLVRSLFGPAVQWLTVLFPAIYLIIIIIIGYYWQPIVDFRPYKIGTYISSGNEIGGEDYRFIYSKNGESRYFTLDNLPDSTWTFVDREEVGSSRADSVGVVVNPIAIYDGDVDVTDDVLSTDGEVILLLISDISGINVASTFKINELYESMSESGVAMICLTGGSDKEIDEWREISMADYPIYKMDDSQLKTIARGNPALVRLEDGKIIWKSSLDSVDLADLPKDIDEDISTGGNMKVLLSLSLALVVVMSLLLMVNRSILLIKLTKRLGKNRNK